MCWAAQHWIVTCRQTLKRQVNSVRWWTSLWQCFGVPLRAFLSQKHTTVRHQRQPSVPSKSTCVHCHDVRLVTTFCMTKRSWRGGLPTIPTLIQCMSFIQYSYLICTCVLRSFGTTYWGNSQDVFILSSSILTILTDSIAYCYTNWSLLFICLLNYSYMLHLQLSILRIKACTIPSDLYPSKWKLFLIVPCILLSFVLFIEYYKHFCCKDICCIHVFRFCSQFILHILEGILLY